MNVDRYRARVWVWFWSGPDIPYESFDTWIYVGRMIMWILCLSIVSYHNIRFWILDWHINSMVYPSCTTASSGINIIYNTSSFDETGRHFYTRQVSSRVQDAAICDYTCWIIHDLDDV